MSTLRRVGELLWRVNRKNDSASAANVFNSKANVVISMAIYTFTKLMDNARCVAVMHKGITARVPCGALSHMFCVFNSDDAVFSNTVVYPFERLN
jgi:hypothetical protein